MQLSEFKQFNFSRSPDYHVTLKYNPEFPLQYCGESSGLIVPWFVEITQLIDDNEPELSGTEELIELIAKSMDDVYGHGGFNMYPFSGDVMLSGVYRADNDEDPPLEPLVQAIYENVHLYVYPYAITALVDTTNGNQKIARFD